MSNIQKRDQRVLYDPWRDFLDVGNIFPTDFIRRSQTNLPAVNISEDDKSFCVDIVAPGFKKDDFKVNVEDDMLTISAEVKSEKSEEDKKRQYTRREYSYNSFTRSFKLPENAKDDNISADFNDGVLKLTIPKSEMQVKATKEIHVN
jgi:HSP20 family protein